MNLPCRWVAVWLFVLLLCVASTAVCVRPIHSQENLPQVVILNSYHQGEEWSDTELAGILTAFTERRPNLAPSIEHLDAKRFPDPAHLERVKGFLAEKYRGKPVDLVMALDNPAFDLILKHRDEIFPGAPVVFAGINNFDPKSLEGRTGITGVAEELDVAGNIELILSIHPRTRQLLAIYDETSTGLAIKRDLEAVAARFQGRVDIRFNTAMSMSALRQEVAALPSDSVALILSFVTDSEGRTFSRAEGTELIASVSPVPVYAMHETRLGHGIVGGYLLTGLQHGRQAAEIALRVLDGEDPAQIPVQHSESRLLFDDTQLQRWRIDESILPPGSQVVNRPFSLYEQYGGWLWLSLSAIIVEAVLILLLVLMWRRSRRAQQALQRRSAIDAALSDLSTKLLDPGAKIEQIAHTVLEYARALTGSEHGYVGAIDPETGDHIGYTLTEMMGRTCQVSGPDAHIVFPRGADGRYHGLWGHSLNTREPFFTNEPLEHSAAAGLPEGHIPLRAFLSVPVVLGIDVLGQIALANAPQGYTTEALEVVRRLGSLYGAFLRHWRMAESLRESEQRFRLLFEQLPVAYQSLDLGGHILEVNDAWLAETGYVREEVIGRWFGYLLAGDGPDLFCERFVKFKQTGKLHDVEFEIKRKDGRVIIASYEGCIGRDAKGTFLQTHCIFTNTTERRRAEEERARMEAELRQAHKMEAVGRLAGGVAHDFNNMLTVILGYLSMILSELDPADRLYHDLREIEKAAQHSAELTQQLLGFSRKQVVAPQVINLNDAVAAREKMLARLIGEDIQVEFFPAADLWDIHVDPTQVDQILTNLAANARDAIKGVGAVTIETTNVVVDGGHPDHKIDLWPGDYVMLSFSDTGPGMDAATLEHIFEPFFTTKPVGQGTGLGLSTVYGIVKQNNGGVYVYSEPGLGTTFHIYFPRFQSETERAGETKAEATAGGRETVLVVEDEEQILSLVRRILERRGYKVLMTRTPAEARRLVEQYNGRIDLLLTDVVMPAMNGKDLQAKIKESQPHIKTLFMSGYTANVIAHRGIVEPGVHFIQKPFALEALARKVRDVLDS